MSDSDDQVSKKPKDKGSKKMSNKRASKLYETHSTDSNQSTQTAQEIEILPDILIETHDDLNRINLKPILPNRVDNKAAERSRLYRKRHREQINQQRREMRRRQQNLLRIQRLSELQNIHEIEGITQGTSNNQMSVNPHTQRQRRYYERHKEEINKRKRENRLKQKVSQSILTNSSLDEQDSHLILTNSSLDEQDTQSILANTSLDEQDTQSFLTNSSLDKQDSLDIHIETIYIKQEFDVIHI